MRATVRGYTSRGNMNGFLDDLWGTAQDVVTDPAIWGAWTGNQPAPAQPPQTIIYQAPAAQAPAAPKDYTPWIIGGALALGLGFLILSRDKK